MKDDTITAQMRRTILNSIEEMDIEMLKRIAYECRCEEYGIYPDMTYITIFEWKLTSSGSFSLLLVLHPTMYF